MKKLLHTSLLTSLFCFLAYTLQAQVLFSEAFSGVLPAGWTNDSLGSPSSNVWLFNNPYGRNISGAGFSGNFAIFDSDEGGVNDNIDEDASLTTVSIDISSATDSLFLEFDQQYRIVSGSSGSTVTLAVSTDNGVSWTTIDSLDNNLGYPNPAVHSVYDLTNLVGNPSLMVRFRFRGTWDWWWAIDNVTVIHRAACTAPPVAGSAITAVAGACPSDSFLVQLSGHDVGTGITFQWQSSTDSISWGDITGATGALAYVAQTTPMYYRAGVTCSGQTVYSSAVFVPMGNPTDCYCIPEFTIGCDVLNKVVINTLVNDNSGCNGFSNNYILYPDSGQFTTTLGTGMSYVITVASGPGSGTHAAAVWFDFNHDGDFQDAGEYFHISDAIPENSGDYTDTVYIPVGANTGLTRMRVRYIYDILMSPTDDCSENSFGETEDYMVDIQFGTGITETGRLEFSVYPSPAKEEVYLDAHGIQGTLSIIVTDVTGRVVSSFESEGGKLITIPMANCSNGLYFIRAQAGGSEHTVRVIKAE